MIELTYKVEGTAELLASLSRVQEGLIDLRELGTWDWVATEFRKIEREIFDSEGSNSAAGKWAPLSPPYAERKLRQYGPVPILQASGRMYRAMTGSTGDSVVEQRPQEMTIGTSLKYPIYHATGTQRMPKRSPVELNDDQKRRLGDPIRKKLLQLIDNAKLKASRGF